jgi:hypothetical protein
VSLCRAATIRFSGEEEPSALEIAEITKQFTGLTNRGEEGTRASLTYMEKESTFEFGLIRYTSRTRRLVVGTGPEGIGRKVAGWLGSLRGFLAGLMPHLLRVLKAVRSVGRS